MDAANGNGGGYQRQNGDKRKKKKKKTVSDGVVRLKTRTESFDMKI